MVDAAADAARVVGGVDRVVERDRPRRSGTPSLIREVRARGGTPTRVGVGASSPTGHRTARFDVDDDALAVAVDAVARAVRGIGEQRDRRAAGSESSGIGEQRDRGVAGSA
jgi:aminobenzoyl-glutamate utilization protein A